MGMKDKTNWSLVDSEIRTKLIEEYNRKAVTFLQQLGERVVKYARNDESIARHYTDRTGNLRNSIGYVVVQGGRVVSESFKGNTPPAAGYSGGDGRSIGRAYALTVAQGLPSTKTYLVWVAGMEYASYVEARGYDVIQGSGDWIEANEQKEKDKFKRYLLSKRK